MERQNANPRLIVTYARDMSEARIERTDAAYDMDVSDHQEYESEALRYVYQSPKQPRQWIAFDMSRRSAAILKTQKVGGGFRSEDYVVGA